VSKEGGSTQTCHSTDPAAHVKSSCFICVYGAWHNTITQPAQGHHRGTPEGRGARWRESFSAHADTESYGYHTFCSFIITVRRSDYIGPKGWLANNKQTGQLQTSQGKERRTESVMNKPALQGFRIHNPLTSILCRHSECVELNLQSAVMNSWSSG
jgi:hypothetical protein